MTSSAHALAPEPCARIARGDGSRVERCGLCEARPVSICDAVEESQWAELARETSVVEVERGEVFRHEGDPPDYLFNITFGAVKLFKLLANGRRQIVGFLGVGDFIGFGRPDAAPASAEALTAVRLAALSCRRPTLQRLNLAGSNEQRHGRQRLSSRNDDMLEGSGHGLKRETTRPSLRQ